MIEEVCSMLHHNFSHTHHLEKQILVLPNSISNPIWNKYLVPNFIHFCAPDSEPNVKPLIQTTILDPTPATEQNLKLNILALISDSFCRPQLAEEINHFLFGIFECKEIHPIYNNLNVDVCV